MEEWLGLLYILDGALVFLEDRSGNQFCQALNHMTVRVSLSTFKSYKYKEKSDMLEA